MSGEVVFGEKLLDDGIPRKAKHDFIKKSNRILGAL